MSKILDPWVVRHFNPLASIRLFCFPYAGGSAGTFAPWPHLLDKRIETCAIQLPGRSTRIAEPARNDLRSILSPLLESISTLNDLPFAFYGHSLGGLLAFELTRRCALLGLRMPKILMVSGCSAPQFRKPPKGLHHLPLAEFKESLRDYNGTPNEILENDELMDLVLPALRADFEVVDTYQYIAQPILETPIVAFAGLGDVHVSEESVHGWNLESRHPLQTEWFEGDHFFLHAQREAVVAAVNRHVLEVLANRNTAGN